MLHNVEKVDVPNDRGASDEEDQKETSSSKANALVPKAAATFGHGEATKRDITLNSKKRNAASLPAIAKLERKKPAVAAFNLHDPDAQIARRLKTQQLLPPSTNQLLSQTGALPLPRSNFSALSTLERPSSHVDAYRSQQPGMAIANSGNPFLTNNLIRSDVGASFPSLFSRQPDSYLADPQVAKYLQLQALNRIHQQQNLLGHDLTSSALRLSQSIGGYDAQQWSMTANRWTDPSLTAAALGFSPLKQHFPSHQLISNGLPMYMGEPSCQDRLSTSLLSGPNFGIPAQGFRGMSDTSSGIPLALPCSLARPDDALKLSSHQVLLRHQIEAFQATKDDVTTHTRGRNKPITLGQVGIRCRHCSFLPVARRQKGSTYFPATTQGIYQAAQNMSTTHMQCGLCNEMPDSIKHEFARLLCTKATSSGAGRPYWAKAAKQMGLVDTENGIRFIRDLAPGTGESFGTALVERLKEGKMPRTTNQHNAFRFVFLAIHP